MLDEYFVASAYLRLRLPPSRSFVSEIESPEQAVESCAPVAPSLGNRATSGAASVPVTPLHGDSSAARKESTSTRMENGGRAQSTPRQFSLDVTGGADASSSGLLANAPAPAIASAREGLMDEEHLLIARYVSKLNAAAISKLDQLPDGFHAVNLNHDPPLGSPSASTSPAATSLKETLHSKIQLQKEVSFFLLLLLLLLLLFRQLIFHLFGNLLLSDFQAQAICFLFNICEAF